MTKAAIREYYLNARQNLSEGECAVMSRALTELFFASSDLAFVKVLHLFLPMERRNEPDTWIIVDRIRREFPHVQLSVPRVNLLTSQLENIHFEGLHQIRHSKWGIPEPVQGIPTPSSKVDMVLVPMLAFDVCGNRVGYGKGFYDRFLATCRPDCKKIGLGFFAPVERIDDVDEFDIRLNAAITPTEIFSW